MATLLKLSESYRDRHAISLALLDDEPLAFPLPPWLTVYRLNCAQRTVASLIGLRRLVGQLKPDITVSFLTRSNVASAVAAIGRNHPWIISERTNTAAHLGIGPRSVISKALVRLSYRRAHRVIAVSGGVAANLEENFRVRSASIDVVHNPVDVEGIRAAAQAQIPIEIDGPFVLAVGRLIPSKNYRMLLCAFASSGLDGRLIIAGEGPERADLEKLANELGVRKRVLFPGFLPNPYPLFARASIFALSSNYEGFPNALVEALALSVPVVATNCAVGPAEILAGRRQDEVRGTVVAPAGILCPVGDADAFAQALRLASDAEIRRRVVAGGEAAVCGYASSSAVRRYWEIIERTAQPLTEVC